MAAILSWPTADPSDYLDYTIDYTSWLSTGETIITSTWASSAPGIQFSNPSINVAGLQVTVWITGGTAQSVANIANTITTSQGRIDVRTVILPIGPN